MASSNNGPKSNLPSTAFSETVNRQSSQSSSSNAEKMEKAVDSRTDATKSLTDTEKLQIGIKALDPAILKRAHDERNVKKGISDN